MEGGAFIEVQCPILTVATLGVEELRREQDRDPRLRRVIREVQQGEPAGDYEDRGTFSTAASGCASQGR